MTEAAEFHPGRLWSLWDIMQDQRFARVFNTLAFMAVLADQWCRREVLATSQSFDYGAYKARMEQIEDFGRVIESLGLRVSLEYHKEMVSALRSARDNRAGLFVLSGNTLHKARHFLDRLVSTVGDEAATQFFVQIPGGMVEFYRGEGSLFGDPVANKFSCVQYDIDEAGKCLGLGRSTAAAFHSIRILEAGIRALSRCLGVPDPTKASERNWGKMLDALKKAIDAKWPTNSHRMDGDGHFFDSAYAALAAMQNPWRNATMHLDQKYTPDEAKHIFEVVRGFMRKLADRMDEDGKPPV